MNKNRRNVPNPSPVVHHTKASQPSTSAASESEGHVVYPQLIKPDSRLETVSKAFRNIFSSLTTNTSSNANNAILDESQSPAGFGSYTPSSDADPIHDTQNDIAWMEWTYSEDRPLVLLAYRPSGFQVWDLSNLDKAQEVLYLPSIGTVISACIQPPPIGSHQSQTPRLLLLTKTSDGTIFSVYDLHSYACIKRLQVPNAKSVQANRKFVIISAESTSSNKTTTGLYILSASDDYKLLYAINSALLSLHTLSDPLFHLSSNRLLAYSSAIPPAHRISTQSSYMGTSYPPTSVNEGTPIPKVGTGAASVLTSSLAYVGGGVLTGAMRLGAGVVEGVKLGINASGYGGTPGSGPYHRPEAERGAFSRSAPSSHPSPLSSRGHNRKGSGQRRSAIGGPGYGVGPGEQHSESDSGQWVTVIDLDPLHPSIEVPSTESADQVDQADHTKAGPSSSSRLSRSSSFIVNQPPLTQLPENFTSERSPELVAEFQYLPLTSLASTLIYRGGGSSASTSTTDVRTSSLAPVTSNTDDNMISAVSALQWSPSGTMLAVGGRDGGSLKVFRIVRAGRLTATNTIGDKRIGSGHDEERLKDRVQLIYELQRGMTPAVVQGIRWSGDGLWVGLISDKGTIHVYPIIPDGGYPAGRSHVLGRLTNNDGNFKKDAPTRLSALCRLRRPYVPSPEPASASTSEVDAESTVLQDLRYRSSPFLFLPQSISRSSHRLPSPLQQLPTKLIAAAEDTLREIEDGFQDLLVFDRETGILALQRIHLKLAGGRENTMPDTITGKSIERTSTFGYPNAAGAPNPEEKESSSMPGSLPKSSLLSGVARLSAYARSRDLQLPFSATSARLASTDSVIASWGLRRGNNWKEYKRSWPSPSDNSKRQAGGSLFYAEVTPSTTHLGRIPRPIYLSHQFQFAALTNDYHALVRKFDLNPPSLHLLARKESVIVRTGEGLPNDLGYGASTPSDFDSDAHFLGTNPHLLDLTESPILGGNLGLAIENAPFSSSLASTNSVSSHSRSSRPGVRRSFDDNLTSAMESQLQLNASYSPSGSSSDIASPGHVIPMLPNGRPGSSGSGNGLATGIDAVMRGTSRVGKEVWGNLSNVRSPRLLPTKRNSATADLLKFDEEEEMFMVDDLDGTAEVQSEPLYEQSPALPAAESMLKKDESMATIGPGTWSVPGSVAYPRMTDSGTTVIGPPRPRAGSQTPGSTDDPSWVEQTDVYTQAVEEDARFHDVTGILDEEREEREKLQRKMGQMSTSSSNAPDVPRVRNSKKSAARKKKK